MSTTSTTSAKTELTYECVIRRGIPYLRTQRPDGYAVLRKLSLVVEELTQQLDFQVSTLPDYNPHRSFTAEEEQAIVRDKRNTTVIALVYGVNRRRIIAIKTKFGKRVK